jgi:hypothetical protein
VTAQSFQNRVQPWMMECFGPTISADKQERNHRFLEEALELVQSCGATQSEAHQLVDYVYGRPVGEPFQEVGGVMITLAALCLANDLDMHQAGEVELARIWTKVEQIRAKQAAKPKHSPLPEAPVQPMDIYALAAHLPCDVNWGEPITPEIARHILSKVAQPETWKALPSPPAPALPPLDDTMREILGRPNFTCHTLAKQLRLRGYAIANKAEDEQAVVIHFLLSLYMEHGQAWMDKGNEYMNRPLPAPTGELIQEAVSPNTNHNEGTAS